MNIIKSIMTQDLIVDFPAHRHCKKSVRFADTSTLYLVHRHDDYEEVDRQDLWYDDSDYFRMTLARQNSVRKVRALASAGVPVSYSGAGHEGSPFHECLIGIERLLTSATIVAVMTCRRRCIRVVLEEQARQRQRQRMNSSESGTEIFGWDDIAFASIDATRRAAVRARKLGKLHHDSV